MPVAAGFARRDVTPPLRVPTSLGGTVLAEEVWDPLTATALVLDDGRERVALIGADLCGFLWRPCQDIRDAVAVALGIAPGRVILNASHTHSAPYVTTELNDLLRPYGLQAVDSAYAERLQAEIVAVAQEAALRLMPARLWVGRGSVDRVASNRRPRRADGTVVHRHGRPPAELKALPEGLIDSDVLVVRVDDLEGRPLGAVASYACHPTAAGGDLHTHISADFVGRGRQLAEAALGGAPLLFLQGTAGDVGTGKWIAGTRREDVESMGRRFADGLFAALGRLQPVPADRLLMAEGSVILAFEDFPPSEELVARIERGVAAGDIGQIVAAGDALIMARHREELRHAHIHVVALGDLAICCLPGEVFVAFGLSIKAGSPFRHTLVTAYNDNSLQYIPTAEAFTEGSYELDGGWRYITAGEGEKLAEAALRLLARVKEGDRR